MRGLRWDRSRALWGMLLSVTTCLAAGAASAQVPVTSYVVVQPINVCSTDGNTCPPVINLNDPVTGVNIADSIWSQVGIRVSFLPLVKWNSPTNPLHRLGDVSTDYRVLHVCNCGSGTGACTSPAVPSCSTGSSSNDLTVISQQPSISMNTVPNPTTPLTATPPLPPSGQCAVANGVLQPPCVPVSTSATTINQFYGQFIAPPPGQTNLKILGFSWDNGNGSFISSGASADTVAHELGHVLGLEHTIFNAGPLTCPAPYPNSLCSENLMTAGSGVRQVPSSLNNCGSTATQACWFTQVPPNFTATTTTPKPLDLMNSSQQQAVAQGGFLNPIPSSTTTVTDPIDLSFLNFCITGPTGGRPDERLLAWVLVLPPTTPQVIFPVVPALPPSVSPPPPCPHIISRLNLIQDFDYPKDDADNNVGGTYYIGSWYDTCRAYGARCLIAEFNLPGAAATDYFSFNMYFNASSAPVTDLCGAEIVYLFNDGSIHATRFPCPTGAPPITVATTSQMPDLTMPVEIQSASTFVGATDTPCIPPSGQTTCSAPVAVSDSNITTGVESGGPICLAHGQVVPCP
ncbi:MAG TPA: hypothetical protein VNZ53_58950 [Steroidobacteraceae bacterium]|jgi:hypothetical protein|nr:hypothetical protein [Steroidobacteraceae bacterium]